MTQPEPFVDPAGARPGGWRAPGNRWRASGLATLLAVVVLAVLGGGVASVLVGSASAGTRATWVDALRPEPRNAAFQTLLDRRAAAVRARDRAAFLADVDGFDEAFVRRQGVLYDNLVKLPLAELRYQVEPSVGYGKLIDERFVARFHARVYAPGVTVFYRVTGVDSKVVTVPWVPVLANERGRWTIAGEVSDRGLPYGANGQVWDAGPITVATSARVVAVFSADDAGRADYLLGLAERGLTRVYAVRPGGWDGKVLVTAVQDRRLFDTYFANSPDRVAQVAAIAVPYYDRVVDWHADGVFATTRVVFNPQQLSAQPEELEHDLAHEFAHAAMGPVTATGTPRWLVEGFAEYVAYRGQTVTAGALRRAMRDAPVGPQLPEDGSFYTQPTNYLTSWLACRMIAERYGEAKLIALYESFQRRADREANVNAVLGTTVATLTAQWRDYVARKLA